MNIYDYIVLAAVGAALVCAVVYMVKRRKKGAGCSCGCGSCPYSESCGRRQGRSSPADEPTKKQ